MSEFRASGFDDGDLRLPEREHHASIEEPLRAPQENALLRLILVIIVLFVVGTILFRRGRGPKPREESSACEATPGSASASP